jgi:hypothetical protein
MIDKEHEIMPQDRQHNKTAKDDLVLNHDEKVFVSKSPLLANLSQPQIEIFPKYVELSDENPVKLLVINWVDWLSLHFSPSGKPEEKSWVLDFAWDYFGKFVIDESTINKIFGERKAKMYDLVKVKGTVWFVIDDDLDKADDIRHKWALKKKAARMEQGLHPLTLEEREKELIDIDAIPDDDDDAFIKKMREMDR